MRLEGLCGFAWPIDEEDLEDGEEATDHECCLSFGHEGHHECGDGAVRSATHPTRRF